MTKNMELANYIHQNTEMGIDTITKLLKISKSAKFNEELSTELGEYQRINDNSQNYMGKIGEETKDISTMSKIKTYLSLNMSTMNDKSSSHIAGMMIEGSTMGIIDITKNLQKYGDADKELTQLGEELLKVEQSNVESLKMFL